MNCTKILRRALHWGSGLSLFFLLAVRTAAEPSVVLLQVLGTDGDRITAQLDTAVLGLLQSVETVTVRDFPVAGTGGATLVLQHFDPIALDAEMQLGAAPPALIDRGTLPRYFSATSGEVAVLLAVRPTALSGFVQRSDQLFEIRPSDVAHSSAQYTVAPVAHVNRLRPRQHRVIQSKRLSLRSSSLQGAASTYSGPLKARVAFDISNQMYHHLGNTSQVMDYITSLIAAHSVQFQSDVDLELELGFVHIWDDSIPMPYDQDAEDYEIPLDQFADYWNANFSLVYRDVAFLLWNPESDGGISAMRSICAPRQDYALADPNIGEPWQYSAFGHEFGHTVDAPHTHCLNPPEDYCANDYGVCSAGTCPPESLVQLPCVDDDDCPLCHLQAISELPPPGGTLMSLCAVRRFEFGPQVGDIVSAFIGTGGAACLRETFALAPNIEADTWILSAQPTSNYDGLNYNQAGRSPGLKGSTQPSRRRALMAIDLNNYIGPTSIPVRAILRVYVDSVSVSPGLPPPTMVISRTSSFEETDTWNTAPVPIVGEEEVTWNPVGPGWASINVSSLVDYCWNSSDVGVCFWIMYEQNEVDGNNSWISFRSTEHTDPNSVPFLELEYAP